MAYTLSVWPAGWSRQQRSSVTMVAAGFAILLVLWLMAKPLALAPEPIGPNAQAFAEGTRMTVLLTLIAGVSGLVLGVLAALGKVSRIPPCAGSRACMFGSCAARRCCCRCCSCSSRCR